MARRVLIIDDEENIRQMTRLTLEAAGYEVGEAGSGMEAFAILGGDVAWDVILLDQKMPGMVGSEVFRRIKVLVPSARVIMMTAFASVELAVEVMKLGAKDFVRKPTTPEIVRNAVAAAIARDAEEPEKTTVGSADSQPPHLRTITMNGFTILRHSDNKRVLPQRRNERCFLVRRPDGREQEVVVDIDEQAVTAVEKVTKDLPIEKAFWTEQAERFLSDFLWNDGNVPSSGRLTLKGVEREELESASRKEIKDGRTHSNS